MGREWGESEGRVRERVKGEGWERVRGEGGMGKGGKKCGQSEEERMGVGVGGREDYLVWCQAVV